MELARSQIVEGPPSPEYTDEKQAWKKGSRGRMPKVPRDTSVCVDISELDDRDLVNVDTDPPFKYQLNALCGVLGMEIHKMMEGTFRDSKIAHL